MPRYFLSKEAAETSTVPFVHVTQQRRGSMQYARRQMSVAFVRGWYGSAAWRCKTALKVRISPHASSGASSCSGAVHAQHPRGRAYMHRPCIAKDVVAVVVMSCRCAGQSCEKEYARERVRL
jgi:hypothetical protein